MNRARPSLVGTGAEVRIRDCPSHEGVPSKQRIMVRVEAPQRLHSVKLLRRFGHPPLQSGNGGTGAVVSLADGAPVPAGLGALLPGAASRAASAALN
jgi:hypothetical protein